MDSKCGDSVGSLVDSNAVWIAVDSCLCSRQTLAFYFFTTVCTFPCFLFTRIHSAGWDFAVHTLMFRLTFEVQEVTGQRIGCQKRQILLTMTMRSSLRLFMTLEKIRMLLTFFPSIQKMRTVFIWRVLLWWILVFIDHRNLFLRMICLLSIRNIQNYLKHNAFISFSGPLYQRVRPIDNAAENIENATERVVYNFHFLTLWKQQFVDAVMVIHFMLQISQFLKFKWVIS